MKGLESFHLCHAVEGAVVHAGVRAGHFIADPPLQSDADVSNVTKPKL